jgi:hypothetical protein
VSCIVVRRERRWLLVLASVIAFVVATYAMIWTYGQRPALVSVGVVGLQIKDDSLVVSVVATNTMRCSEPGASVAVAIRASRAPGR